MKWYLAALLAVALPASSADYHVAKTGNDTTGDGAELTPYLTIQKACDVALTSGDRVIVHAGTYTELTDTALVTGLGIQPKADGITIMAANGESVVIDQGQTLSIAGDGTASLPYTEAIFGFSINGYDDITIDGFEIINTYIGVSVQTKDGAASGDDLVAADVAERLIVKNNKIHDVWGQPGTNVGAIHLSVCWYCEAYDNLLYDIGILRDIGGDIYPFCAGCDIPPGVTQEQADSYRQNTGGVFAFDGQAMDVHHNKIWNAGNGIFIKRPYTQSDLAKNDGDGDFHHNLIYDTIIGMRFSTFSGGPPHIYARIFNNIMYSVTYGPMATAISNDSSIAATANGTVVIFNNTLIAKASIGIVGFVDARVFNNIMENTTHGLIRYATGTWPTLYEVADRNIYATTRFNIGGIDLYTLAAWQANDVGDCTDAGGTCGANSDEYDDTADLMFAAGLVEGQAYTLKAGSPAIGMGKANSVNDLPEGATVDAGAFPNGPWSASNTSGDIVGPRTGGKALPTITDFTGT